MRIIVLTNTCFLNEIANRNSQILYCPIFKSKMQKEYFQKRFDNMKHVYPKAKWCEHFELAAKDQVLAWNTHNEKKIFSQNLTHYQNRLFQNLNFVFKDSFSSFKDQAFNLLPHHFDDAIVPFDPEVRKHLDQYFENDYSSHYFETRNNMLGESFSTKFSAYLASGDLDPRHIFNCVKNYEKKHGSNKSTYWIVFELLWREFFYWHYQMHNIKYFSLNGLRGPFQFPKVYEYEIDELKQLSDNRFFIAALNELEQTGFQSNRTRQMFASFWLNDLKLSWLDGAKLFENYLVDYDVYSNYGNWMYLAGVGVDPRGPRYFNIEKQLEKYNPDGSYIKTWY